MLGMIALGAVLLVVVLQVGFMVLEATMWARPLGQRLANLSAGAARETAKVGLNMGLYNGFLALILLWVTLALGARSAYSAQWLVLSIIVAAGIIGAITMKNWGIFLFQSLPAVAALVAITLDRPYPRTEADAIRAITRIERQILALKSVTDEGDKGLGEGGAIPRGQHPKLLGLVRATFTVREDLPAQFRRGIFQKPGQTYDALIRFSNGRQADDQEPGGHGMAIKLIDVSRAGAGADPGTTTQDFVLFDAPVFFVGNPIQYVELEEAVLQSQGQPGLQAAAHVFLGYYWRHPHHFQNLLKARRGDLTDPIASRYWSVTPYRFGTDPVKYSVRPLGPTATAVTVARSPDMFRDAIKARLAQADAEFEFQIQPQADPESMPVEDPTVEWDEVASPPVTVARIRVQAHQDFDTPERRLFAENLSFTPWHSLPEHEPLGGINRVRKEVYESLAGFRHALNHAPQQEPTESIPASRLTGRTGSPAPATP